MIPILKGQKGNEKRKRSLPPRRWLKELGLSLEVKPVKQFSVASRAQFLSFMELPNSSSVRVLVRPPTLSTPTSSSPSQAPLPHSASPEPSTSFSPSSQSPSPSLPRFSDTVVVVGFIGRRPDDLIQLINRVIDSNVFGSGKLDKKLDVEKEEVREWFKRRRISYYHEEERGILFLQFSSHRGSVFDSEADYDSEIQEHDFGDLQGMLFMFSVSARQFLISFLFSCLYVCVHQDGLTWIVCLYPRNVMISW